MTTSKDPERRRAYNRAYRRENYPARIHEENVKRVDRSEALFDPRRDDMPQYASPFDALLGDPPIGRSALDQRRMS